MSYEKFYIYYNATFYLDDTITIGSAKDLNLHILLPFFNPFQYSRDELENKIKGYLNFV